jgi:hypothetical protein
MTGCHSMQALVFVFCVFTGLLFRGLAPLDYISIISSTPTEHRRVKAVMFVAAFDLYHKIDIWMRRKRAFFLFVMSRRDVSPSSGMIESNPASLLITRATIGRYSLYKLLHDCHGIHLDRQYLDLLPPVVVHLQAVNVNGTRVCGRLVLPDAQCAESRCAALAIARFGVPYAAKIWAALSGTFVLNTKMEMPPVFCRVRYFSTFLYGNGNIATA